MRAGLRLLFRTLREVRVRNYANLHRDEDEATATDIEGQAPVTPLPLEDSEPTS